MQVIILQTAVDFTSKMFMSLIVSQKATDHYQLPNIMNKTIKNMGVMPEYCCADAGYNTRRTLEYLEEMGLKGLIDNNRSAKLRNGHSNCNKFHKRPLWIMMWKMIFSLVIIKKS